MCLPFFFYSKISLRPKAFVCSFFVPAEFWNNFGEKRRGRMLPSLLIFDRFFFVFYFFYNILERLLSHWAMLCLTFKLFLIVGGWFLTYRHPEGLILHLLYHHVWICNLKNFFFFFSRTCITSLHHKNNCFAILIYYES